MLLLKNVRYFWDGERIYENVDILVENGEIKIGEKDKSDFVLDCSKNFVLPSFVNAHTHSPMIFLRGYYDDAELKEWLNKIWEMERIKILEAPESEARKLIYYSSFLAIYEMVRTRTTVFVDMYFYSEETAKAVKEFGIKAFLGEPIIFDKGIEKAEKFIKDFKNDENIVPIVNLHAIYSNSFETIEEAFELAKKYDTYLHIHMAETEWEVNYSLEKYGKRPFEVIENLANEKTILVHCCHLSEKEIEKINEKGCICVTCPTSNLKLMTKNVPNVKKFRKILIGTDGPASNNSFDIFVELKIFTLVQKFLYGDFKAEEALKIACIYPRKYLNLKMDLIGINLKKIKAFPPLKERLFSLIYSVTGEYIDFVIANGKIVYPNEKIEEKVEEIKMKVL